MERQGRRLERLVRERWRDVGSGGIRGLCKAVGVTPEALYGWFRGDNAPGMGHLADLARALEVTRAELVAAMDGVKAPVPFDHEVLTRLDDLRVRVDRINGDGRGAPPDWWVRAGRDEATPAMLDRRRQWWLRAARSRLNMTLDEVADGLGYRSTHLRALPGRWERGEGRAPSVPQLRRLAAVYRVPVAEFVAMYQSPPETDEERLDRLGRPALEEVTRTPAEKVEPQRRRRTA